ncbi:MAG: class I SAM-dependent methyltransferase [Trueperaceae bacterium]
MIYDLPELYDAQYQRYRDDLNFYVGLANDYGSPILELGAGTGRVSLALAKAGHTVVGIDYSQRMLERGHEAVVESNLSNFITLLRGDMRGLELSQIFPIIIAPFNTLMHAYTIADQDATLASVKRHLEPGGVFAFDVYAPNFSSLNILRRETEWEHVGGENAELFLYQSLDEDHQILESRYYLDMVQKDGSLTRQTSVLKQRYYTRFELERMIKGAGFTGVQIYGGFDKRRYSHKETVVVVVCKV